MSIIKDSLEELANKQLATRIGDVEANNLCYRDNSIKKGDKLWT